MKTYTEVIKEMYRLNLRKNEQWGYTFCFTENNYKIDLHDHSTGCTLRIDLISPEGETLRIYDLDTWYSSRYEFNNNGKKLGFQHDGPWCKQIADMMSGFEREIEQETNRRNQAEIEQKKKTEEDEKKKLEKFAKLVSVGA